MVTAKEFRILQHKNDVTRRWKKWIEEELMDMVSPDTTRRTDLKSWDFNFKEYDDTKLIVEQVIIPWLEELGFWTKLDGPYATPSEPDEKHYTLRVSW